MMLRQKDIDALGPPEQWPEVLDAVLARRVVEAWAEGAFTVPVWNALGGVAEDRRDVDRALAGIYDALGAKNIEVEVERIANEENGVRRWCWVEAWRLLGQDEDLLLMGDAYVRPLLEEAGAGCRKRDYAISIVAHHARDEAYASLGDDPAHTRDRLAEIGAWSRIASAARALDLAEWLERLSSYARPGPVTREQAEQRIEDLWRCHPERARPVRRQGPEWLGECSAKILRIHAETGAMRATSAG